MEYLEALKASKIGNGLAAPDHYTRLFAQKIGAERSVNKVIDWSPIVHVTDALAKPVVDLKVKITPVQSGTGDPSPDNVRQISGWTGAKVVRCGENLYDAENATLIPSPFDEGKDGIAIILPPGTYTLKPSGRTAEGYRYPYIYGYVVHPDGSYESPMVFSSTSSTAADYTARTRELSKGDWIFVRAQSSLSPATAVIDAHLNAVLGSSFPDTIAPYTGTTYPITFPSEAGTVYGGELDVTSGVLTVDRAMVDLGAMRWTKNDTSTVDIGYYFLGTGLTNAINGDTTRIISSYLYADVLGLSSVVAKYGTSVNHVAWSFRTASSVYLIDGDYSTAEEFKQAVNGVKMVYRLATPLTYQLTPTEVTTLLGVNNIWADTGDSYLVYKAKKTKG